MPQWSPFYMESTQHSGQVLYEASSLGYPNIALIKYWGKRTCPWQDGPMDESEQPGHYDCGRFGVSCNHPINDSISVTLGNEHMKSFTTIELCQMDDSSLVCHEKKACADRMYLNGQEIDISRRYRRLVHIMWTFISRNDPVLAELVAKDRIYVRICTKNYFPTAVGLASSASGASAFAGAMKRLCDKIQARDTAYLLPHPTVLARFGSGSGCRSLCDGFALWRSDSTDHRNENGPCAVSIASSQHWTNLHVLILVFPFRKGTANAFKEISSERGMETSLRSSPLVHQRTVDGSQSPVKEARITRLTTAIRDRDFSTLAEITMAESDELHSICATSAPVIRYLNTFSETMIQFIQEYNALKNVISETNGTYYCAYSFDAGPNMFVFCEEPLITEIYTILLDLFPGTGHTSCFLQSPLNAVKQKRETIDNRLRSLITAYTSSIRRIFDEECNSTPSDTPYLPYVYHSTPGGGVVV